MMTQKMQSKRAAKITRRRERRERRGLVQRMVNAFGTRCRVVHEVPGRTFWRLTDHGSPIRSDMEDIQPGDRFAWLDNLRPHPLAGRRSSVPIVIATTTAPGVVAFRFDRGGEE